MAQACRFFKKNFVCEGNSKTCRNLVDILFAVEIFLCHCTICCGQRTSTNRLFLIVYENEYEEW